MKRLLLLITISAFILTFTSCDNNSSTSVDSTSDSTKDSGIAATAKDTTAQSKDISKYLIDKTTFDGITKNVAGDSKDPKEYDSSLKADIIAQYQSQNGVVISVKGKYRNADTLRYASTRGMLRGSDSARVKNYKTYLYKVVVPGTANAAESIFYYDVITIKPPPEETVSKD